MARAMRTAAATVALLGLIISAIDEADNEQNDAGANEGIDDRAEDSATNQNTDCRQQPSRNGRCPRAWPRADPPEPFSMQPTRYRCAETQSH
jgi:hypothetical protein